MNQDYIIMNEQFVTFQSFTDPHIAQEVAQKLNEQGIQIQFEDTSSPIDPVIIGSPLTADLRLKLRAQDFAKANIVLETYYSEMLGAVEEDYYLFSFSDAELMEIIEKPDEWGKLDYMLAQKILKEKGKDLSIDTLTELKNNRLKEIAKPEQVGKSWIILGYFFAVLFSPVGIFYSSTILTLKRTLPNGQRSYTYVEGNRKHARKMLIISLALTSVWLLIRVLRAKG